MILIHTRKLLLAGLVLSFLAACSATTTTGSGGGDTGSGDTGGGDTGGGDTSGGDTSVTTGSIDGEISGNGLDFADGLLVSNRENIVGTDMTLRALKLVKTVVGETTTLSAELIDATITIAKDEAGVKWTAMVNFDGETSPTAFELTKGHAYTSSDGLEYSFYIDSVTDNIFVIESSGSNPSPLEVDQEDRWFYAYTGFETNPDVLLESVASATYAGEFSGLIGSALLGDLEIGGNIVLTADFDAGLITDGLMTATVDTNTVDVAFDGDILGSGWNATITDIDIDLDGNDSVDFGLVGEDGGQLDGVFYAQDGEETAGTMIIDATVTNDIDDYDIVGGGGFVACDITVDEGLCILP